MTDFALEYIQYFLLHDKCMYMQTPTVTHIQTAHNRQRHLKWEQIVISFDSFLGEMCKYADMKMYAYLIVCLRGHSSCLTQAAFKLFDIDDVKTLVFAL